MEKIQLTKDQYEELLGTGKITFCGHTIYLIYWQTYYSKVALFVDTRNDEKRIVELKVA